MSWFEATLLGLLQGLTEFLPVSSSGHLQLGQAILGTTSEDNLTFTVLLHVATVCATLLVFYKEILKLIQGCFTTKKMNEEKHYVAKLIVSMIPVLIVGLFFKDKIEEIFDGSLLIVGICLIITALLLTASEYLPKLLEKKAHKKHANEVKDLTYWQAAVIGVAQAIAVLPGLSRSGTTIATGLLCGVKKSSVAQFSFLMVIVPILGDAFLDSLKLILGKAVMPSISAPCIIMGFLAAFVSGYLACKFMINIVKKQKLIYFAIYCLIVGILAICL